jgi:hypothetical protein
LTLGAFQRSGTYSGTPVVSPFVGRLDDREENGMDPVRNIKQMYEAGDGHVHVLAASIRHLKHLLGSFDSKADLVAATRFPVRSHQPCHLSGSPHDPYFE